MKQSYNINKIQHDGINFSIWIIKFKLYIYVTFPKPN